MWSKTDKNDRHYTWAHMKNDSSRGTNGVRHDVVHRLYQDVLYCQNFVWFHGTRVNVIIYPHKPSRASHVAILTKLSYNLLYRISPNSDNTRKKNGQKFMYGP